MAWLTLGEARGESGIYGPGWAYCAQMGENVERRATHRSPIPEEFEEARKRELARLNVRLSDLTGEQYHTSEDLKLLEGDTEQQQSTDKDTVRLWTANSEKYGGGTKSA